MNLRRIVDFNMDLNESADPEWDARKAKMMCLTNQLYNVCSKYEIDLACDVMADFLILTSSKFISKSDFFETMCDKWDLVQEKIKENNLQK